MPAMHFVKHRCAFSIDDRLFNWITDIVLIHILFCLFIVLFIMSWAVGSSSGYSTSKTLSFLRYCNFKFLFSFSTLFCFIVTCFLKISVQVMACFFSRGALMSGQIWRHPTYITTLWIHKPIFYLNNYGQWRKEVGFNLTWQKIWTVLGQLITRGTADK